MSTLTKIEQEGYREEDLSERDAYALRWLRFLQDSFKNGFMYDFEDDATTIIGRIKQEVSDDVVQQINEWLEMEIAEIQITFAEHGKDW